MAPTNSIVVMVYKILFDYCRALKGRHLGGRQMLGVFPRRLTTNPASIRRGALFLMRVSCADTRLTYLLFAGCQT